MRLSIFNEPTLIHHDDLVEIKDDIDSVRDGNDCVGGELGMYKTLYNRFGARIEATRDVGKTSQFHAKA
jgi:hypothetical protein